jgi:hypothetical protein
MLNLIKDKVEDVIAERSQKGPILKKLKEIMFKSSTKCLDAEKFFVMLREDLPKAKNYVLIVSPFLREIAIKKFLNYSEVQDCINKVKFIVVTKSVNEIYGLNDKKEHEKCIQLLKDNGIKVFSKEKLHFKAVIIDDEILYVGSINPLSVITINALPADYMLRFDSEALVNEIIETAIGKKDFEEYIS